MPSTNRLRGRPKEHSDDASQVTIRTLDRALDVLAIVAEKSGLSLSDIASALSQSPSTTHRVLATLERRGFVQIDPVRQLWRIGPAAFQIGSAFLRDGGVVERARPTMHSLMEATGETANLGIERSGVVLFLSQVETHETIRAFFPPGVQSPMHASGVGKALLSRYDAEKLEIFFQHASLERFTGRTIVAPEALLDDLAESRSRGYAFDDEERNLGMRCIAAPVRNVYNETVAGISVSGPTSRITDARIGEIGAQVAGAAEALSISLGAPQDLTVNAAVAESYAD